MLVLASVCEGRATGDPLFWRGLETMDEKQLGYHGGTMDGELANSSAEELL